MEGWESRIESLKGEAQDYMLFLAGTMPQSDLDCYPFDLFLEFANHAVMLRKFIPWCVELEEDIFRHYVLYHRVNDEDIVSHRPLFFHKIYDRVKDLSVEDAVLEINRWCHEAVTYQAQDERTASPLTVYRAGSGRCGEESTFLVSALRSVGIAARQVYVPRWSHCDDNHAWVEAYCGRRWRFLGACEPEPVLDRGWFNISASRAMLVHSRKFGSGDTDGGKLDTVGNVAYYNQTARYAKTKKYVFRVMDMGEPVSGAKVQIEILNSVEFFPIITLQTDSNGEVAVEMGKGDIHLFTSYNGRSAEGICHGREEASLVLKLGDIPYAGVNHWQDFEFLVPNTTPANSMLLTDLQKQQREEALHKGDMRRQKRISGFFDEMRAKEFPDMHDILVLSCGNFEEVYTFLRRDGNPLRRELLRSLNIKDLRDITADILEDHLTGAAVFFGRYPDDIYTRFLLCPRIAFEKLTAWRRTLSGVAEKEKETYLENPMALWKRLRKNVRIERERIHKNLYWPPDMAFSKMRCDERSLRVLFIALLRAWGLPARFNPIDGITLEYWTGKTFAMVEPCVWGDVRFEKRPRDRFLYNQNWTVSRLCGEEWRTLQLPDEGWQEDLYRITLPVGHYRLLTSTRLPNGTQFASRRNFEVNSGQPVQFTLRMREYCTQDILTSCVLPAFSAKTLEGQEIYSPGIGNGCALLLWIEPGTEPTEHILNELMTVQKELQGMSVTLYIFVRKKQFVDQLTLASLLVRWPDINVFFGNWETNLETLAKPLGCDADHLPLVIIYDQEGHAVYAVNGYNVGIVKLIVQIFKYLLH